MKQPYNTALYMRLSRDDETYGELVPKSLAESPCPIMRCCPNYRSGTAWELPLSSF